MFNTKLLSFLLLVPYNLKMQSLSNEPSYNIEDLSSIKTIPGTDERYNNTNMEDDMIKLHEIKEYIIKKNLLEILNNSNSNIHHKLYIIEKYLTEKQSSIRSYDLTSGNLFKDFYDNTTELY